jgi:thiosulfate/3-mercaptopyruvate sulfurtransferase
VDARDEDRFAGRSEPIDAVAGHIPGSINVPFTASLADDGTWRDVAELRQLWRHALAESHGAPWSVMCGSGVTACHLVVSGLIAGLPEPRVYVGSWSEWITDPRRPVGGRG